MASKFGSCSSFRLISSRASIANLLRLQHSGSCFAAGLVISFSIFEIIILWLNLSGFFFCFSFCLGCLVEAAFFVPCIFPFSCFVVCGLISSSSSVISTKTSSFAIFRGSNAFFGDACFRSCCDYLGVNCVASGTKTFRGLLSSISCLASKSLRAANLPSRLLCLFVGFADFHFLTGFVLIVTSRLE